MRFLAIVLLTLALLSVGIGAASADVTLARAGRTDYQIVVSGDATQSEKTAARELRDYLKQITGADVPIASAAEVSYGTPRIVVGQSPLAKRLAAGVDWKSLGHDGIVIRTVGADLVLAGGRPRGTLYAVYEFLERIGCRWWASDASYIPRRSTLRISDMNLVYAPKLIYREAHYRDPNENALFATKLRVNGHFHDIPDSYGGHYSIIGWCHTFFNFLPPGKYFAEHPDWYSELGGKRTPDWGQVCLTSQGARDEMAKVVLQQIRADPGAGIISVSQNDGFKPCECAKCQEVVKREGAESGPMIEFVNYVAEQVEKEFPDVLVETLAYQYSRKPPARIKPRKNVVVRLCSIECSFVDNLDSELNKSFRDDIRGWAAVAPNLYIWNYVTNFANYIIPHPNMRTIAPNIRFFADNNTIGVFEQGDTYCSIGDFVRMRAWLHAKLMWDPSLDDRKLISEYLNGYYGPAGSYLEQYINLMHSARERSGVTMGCSHLESRYFTLSDMQQATQLWNQAEDAVAKDAELAKRVKRDRLTFDHIWFLRYHDLKAEADKAGVKLAGPTDPKAAVQDFLKTARLYDPRMYCEWMPFESYAPVLEAVFEPPAPKPEEFDKLPAEDCNIVQQDKFVLYRKGECSDEIDDPTASDGKTAKLFTNTIDWAVQYQITADDLKKMTGRWKFYAVVRIDALTDHGSAFRYGVYDGGANRQAAEFLAKIEDCKDGKYHTWYMGTYEMRPGLAYYFVSAGIPDQVKGIYIDRVVMVRDKD